jgi:hypothetical protein
MLTVRLTCSSTLKLEAFKVLRDVGRSVAQITQPWRAHIWQYICIRDIWNFVEFGFLHALTMKSAVLWSGTPCSSDGLWSRRRYVLSKYLTLSELHDVMIEIWNIVWSSEHLKIRSEDSGGHRRPMKWFSGLSNLYRTNALMPTFSKKSP